MELSENIRRIRKQKHLTQEQLAEAMDVSAASVSKWETGQSAPELAVLADLADYFAVSVDTLMGHTVCADRMEQMLAEMDALFDAGNYPQARQMAEKLLRCYPNSEKVVKRTSNLYNNVFLFTQEREAMTRSIELTRRLFALTEDGTEAERFELLRHLAAQYEMLQDWETAQKLYEEGNVCGVNDRALARCLANAGKPEQALAAVSDVFSHGLFELVSDAVLLEQIWKEMGEPEKGAAALRWGCAALEALGPETAASFSGLALILYTELAKLEEEKGNRTGADAWIHRAVALTKTGVAGAGQPEFLRCGGSAAAEPGSRDGIAMLEAWLTGPEKARLLSVVREEAQR